MSYVANQYNYATPLSSVADFALETSVADKKYFTLLDNNLDGSFSPISGYVGLWGAETSDANGNLLEPFVVTITENLTLNAFRLISSSYNYPVSFTVNFYNGDTLLYTITENNNTSADYKHYLSKTLIITGYTITIDKISRSNDVARVYNAYNLGHVKRSDTLHVNYTEASVSSDRLTLRRSDRLSVASIERQSYVHNTIDKTFDTLNILCSEAPVLTNVHTRMKDPSRRIFGKVYITYTDPMLESDTVFDYSTMAYNSHVEQLTDNVHESEHTYFTLYDNDLTGRYKLSDSRSQVGWTSSQLSKADGTFDGDVWVSISFEPRPVKSFTIAFDDKHGNLVKDFAVLLVTTENAVYNYEYRDNTDATIEVNTEGYEIKTATILVARVAKPFYPATILSLPLSSTILYTGYEDQSELINIDLLEELTYEDEIEALGGVSANEVTVALDNSNKDFYFNSRSLVSKQLKRNRKIAPWLGVEIDKGLIEWYALGTFWSYKWDVPTNGLSAKVVGFDTIGLLDTTSFMNHKMLINKSVAELIAYVLDDAKSQLNFIEYVIDPALSDIVIPYAWFEKGSHTKALRKISMCYPMHIYCDRQGRICAAPQKLRLDYYYDIWSNSTNVIDKNYSSLYTVLPNIINVSVVSPTIESRYELAKDETVFTVPLTRTIMFDKPCIDEVNFVVDCDSTVTYTYEAYSWGAIINFAGAGQVRSVTCVGDALDTSSTNVVTETDYESVRLNGGVTRDVSSPFIQTKELANTIIGRITSLSEYDKYDASVDYRGDISLTINDPILLRDGIAPSDKYNIKRHQLFWDGGLSGSAELNT